LEVNLAFLHHRYGRVVSNVLEKVSERRRNVALKIIGWVVAARRPLKWREIQATFFINYERGASEYEDDRLRDSGKWFCGSLIDLQSITSEPIDEATISLVHNTARE
jgi:hypothetical protein